MCNGHPDRAPQIAGNTFVLCWRCSGIFLGIVIFSPLFIFVRDTNFALLLAGVIGGFPSLADALIQKNTSYTSTNMKRFISGIFCGLSLLCIGRLVVWSVLK
ncbi:MAG: DUF2085 domain-containing protein [Fastidiosipilaceae bacterium]